MTTLVDRKGAAAMLGVSTRTVDRWVANGSLPVAAETPSGRRRFDPDDLLAAHDQHTGFVGEAAEPVAPAVPLVTSGAASSPALDALAEAMGVTAVERAALADGEEGDGVPEPMPDDPEAVAAALEAAVSEAAATMPDDTPAETIGERVEAERVERLEAERLDVSDVLDGLVPTEPEQPADDEGSSIVEDLWS